jgi:hypothetical protein
VQVVDTGLAHFLIFLWLRKPLENWCSIRNDDSGKKGTARLYSKKMMHSFGVPISGLNDIPWFLSKQIFLQAKLIFLRYPKEIFLTFPFGKIICLGIAVAPL